MHSQIPPEVWRNIFRFATFTAISLNVMDWDPYWPYARSEEAHPTKSYQSTLPTKKALTLVSRHFRELSLQYLFEVVQLFHTRNAQLLLDAILLHTTGTRSSPTRWIKYITVDLDSNDDSHLMDGVLKKIFPHCERLAAFGWEAKERLRGWMSDDASELMASIPLSITALEWHRNSLGKSFNSLRNHTALRTLRVSDVLSVARDDHAVAIPTITHLDVRTPLTCIAVSRWELPSVAHLTIDWIDEQHFDRLLGDSESRNAIRSFYIPDPLRCRSDDFPRILASMPKLETFSYDIAVNPDDQTLISPTWVGVGSHASLANIYLFCRVGMDRLKGKASFLTIRDFFFGHLKPLTTRHVPLTIGIMDAQVVFEQGDFLDKGYDAEGKQRFFDDLSANLTSPVVNVIVKWKGLFPPKVFCAVVIVFASKVVPHGLPFAKFYCAHASKENIGVESDDL
ncbi:hypothetical protein BD410DRAFT_901135 [Rickenella mellea]|uniref:F-box domain-containing protein n=1 Tax=Rickenella mellea TaxID=50990 RepID=A0A4Y7PTN2_9AGAM|nr:hypothetical protein BD410DRAFT_901135 [Rickenella mellea]